MHLLHQSSLHFLNFGEFKEAIVSPMGCISVHKGLTFQTPAFGVVSNLKRKKEQACVLVLRRRNCIRNAVSITQKENNVVVKEDAEFKSSFDEYLKAMESIRVEREKKQVQRDNGRGKKSTDVVFSKDVSQRKKRGETSRLPARAVEEKQVQRRNDHGKKSTDVAFSEDVSQHEKRRETGKWSTRAFLEKKQVQRENGRRKKLNDVSFSRDVLQRQKLSEINKFKGIKRLDYDDGVELSQWSKGVIDKKELSDGAEVRTIVRTQKDLNYIGSKNGLSKKLDDDTTASRSTEFVKKKSTSMHEMSIVNDSEMDRFILRPSVLLNDSLQGPRVSQMEMEERIQALARCLNEAHTDMPEWMFSKTMRSARIRFSDSSIMRVIKMLGKFGNWRRVLQVIEWLQVHERFKSHKIRYVYTAALDVLGNARRPVEALNLFYAMQRHKTTYPDIVTYHSIAITLGQAGHMREIFDVIDSMRSMPKNFKIDDLDDWDPRLEPDIVIYNAVLNGCAKRKEWEGAIWVLQKLEEIGEQPSSATYGLAMEVMLACGKYDLVHEYFKQLQGFTVPNALSYRVLVNTLWREGKPDEAITVVQDMESQGLVGPASLYYDLARCLCSVGRCEEGLMQVDKICKVASKPLVVTYTGLIQACLTNGNIHDATTIFDHMQKYCSPNTVTCNIMLKAYLEYKMFDEAKDLFHKMTQNGRKGRKTKGKIMPNFCTFKMMLEAFIKEQRWDDFEYAYEKMLQHGHPFNTKRHLWMVLQASRAGKVEIVETTWRNLLQTNRIPPPALVKEQFRLKMETNNLVEAVSSIACHPSSPQLSFSKEAWLNLFNNNAECFSKETLAHLICEVNNSLSKSESPNLIYQNLLDSCMEYVNLDSVPGKIRKTETPVNV